MIRAIFHHPCGPWLAERIAEMETRDLSIEIVADATGPALEAAFCRADVLLHVLHPVTAGMIDKAPSLRLIQKIGVGLDAIDRDAARARGIAVCNMPGTNTQAVVELTLGLMLSVLRRIPSLDHRLRAEGDWALPASAQGAFSEISDKTVGLVGHGHVARRLALVLDALGAKVLIHSRTPVRPEIGDYATKPDLLARSDVLSLHIPETPETRNWLDAPSIAAMKPGAVLINTARGGLVDQAALCDALASGHLAGAGLDVYATEPVQPSDPILAAPNVVALPHLAWMTRETLQRSLAAASENIRRLRQGEPLNDRHA